MTLTDLVAEAADQNLVEQDWVKANEQAEAFENIARMVRETGVRMNVTSIRPLIEVRTYSSSLTHLEKQDHAVLGSRLTRALGGHYLGIRAWEKLEALDYGYEWGITTPRGDLPFHFRFGVARELTCKQELVLDDEGLPIMEMVEQEVYSKVEVEKAKTKRVCTNLFETVS